MWRHVHRDTNEHEYKLVRAQLRVHTFQPIFLHLCPFYITEDWNPFLWIINGPFENRWSFLYILQSSESCLTPLLFKCANTQRKLWFFAVSQSTCTLTCNMSLLVLQLSFTWVSLHHVHILHASRRTWKLINTKTIRRWTWKIIKGKNAVVCEFVCRLWAAGRLVAAVLTHCVLARSFLLLLAATAAAPLE